MTLNFRDHRIYLTPLLRALHKHGATPPSKIYDEVADVVGVSAEDRNVGSAKGGTQPVYRNRIQFARQSLIDAGLLISSSEPGWRRGIWELNEEGHALAEKTEDDSELEELVQSRANEGARQRALERRRSRALAGLDAQEVTEEGDETGDEGEEEEVYEEYDLSEQIGELVEEANQAAKEVMLGHIRSLDDTAFEHLVGDVLKKALRAVEVQITPRTRDGGIDGVLYFDSLKMRTVVFEAKRYRETNTVGRPAIDAFSAVARRRGATHALFVTSGNFSRGAEEAARLDSIRLINGMALVELMAETGIGLRPKETHIIYGVDPNWSIDLDEV